MRIAMIAAMAANRVIGANNEMPWHLPADLKHFKSVTMGKPVIMGRKTYESIGRALPGRTNIVITRQPDYQLADAQIVSDPDKALTLAERTETDEVMIIGGGTIYDAFMPYTNTLYLTHIEATVKGDTHFPDYEAAGQWQEVASEHRAADERNDYACRFVTLKRL